MDTTNQGQATTSTVLGNGRQAIPITIDKQPFKAPKTPMTGSELRALPKPDVPADRDLWLEIPGPGDDILVLPTLTVDLKPGMHFYTAPTTINPGESSRCNFQKKTRIS